MSNYPDFNKQWDGTDNNLCWAAACANALCYTGWSDLTLEQTFNYFKALGNYGGTATYGFNLFFRDYLHRKQSLAPYIRILAPSSLWFCKNLESLGACAVLTLKRGYKESGHIVTAYKAVMKTNKGDPREISHFVCTDSDDDQFGDFELSVNYDINDKKMKTDYHQEDGKVFISMATVLFPE